ncbi:MAG TPA: BamA/TamA family outer membrane protein [Vicinamibacterales bacterium]|nr:BamA/TamA family outer membrane protein [Vicinamibacterales bacterium]
MPASGVCCRVLVLVVAAFVVCAARPVSAQYFGRNKVEYRDFDYRLLKTEHFDIYYDRRDERSVRHAARMAERWYERLSTLLDHEFTSRQPLILYGSHPAFGQTNIVAGQLDEAIGGVTESGRRRIAMPFAATLADTDHVLGHEIVHAFQFDMAKRHRVSRAFPLWMAEGMAEYLTVGPRDSLTAAWVRDALARDRFPEIDDLGRGQYSAYRFGHAFWAWLVSRHGESIVRQMLRQPPAAKVMKRLEAVSGRRVEDLGRAWKRTLHELHPGEAPRDDERPSRVLVTSKKGRLHIAPAISPDGSRIAFVSERDGISVSLYVADAATGRTLRRLLTSVHDIELESLQYVHSAGAWRPDGNRIAFAAVRGGKPVLLIIDPETGRRDRDIPFPQLGEVLTPTWSPDGKRIAFSALDGGATDLYVYDVEADELKQLTNDVFADVQPAWSPDGELIAFATERFSSDLDAARFGPLQLALLDLDTGRIELVETMPGVKAINPQWTADSRSLCFVSDPHGASDIFRIDLATRSVRQLTSVETSVMGLTPASPAISVAARAGTIAFTVLRDGRFEIRAIEDAAQTELGAADAGQSGLKPCSTRAGNEADTAREGPRTCSTQAAGDASDRALLAPFSSGGAMVAAALNDARTGLPEAELAESTPYRPQLSLDGVAQPYLSSGASRFGSYLRAGASVMFDDLMGEQVLGIGWQAGTRLYDLAVDVRYLNRGRRWNWGIVTERRPLVRTRSIGELTRGGERPVLSQETELQVQRSTRFGGFLAYPFSRAQRVELGAGIRHLDFARELIKQSTVFPSGRRLVDEREDLPAAVDVLLGEAGIAFVHDHARWGVAGPRMGSRWRAEAVFTTGELTYTTLSLDYRRYFMPVQSVTIAARLAPSIRLGGHADDPRLFPIYAGTRVPVRGYSGRTLTADCAARAAEGCIAGDDLFGHRVVAANLEIRVPFTVIPARSSFPLRAEAIVFADAAFLWSRGTSMASLGSPLAFDASSDGDLAARPSDRVRQHRIRSFGAGVRLNALGMILEVDVVKPLDRLRNGWTVGVFAKPGF